MSRPLFTLTFPPLPHAAALATADRIEAIGGDDYVPVAVNEIDEKAELWEVVAYCGDAQQAALLRERIIASGAFFEEPVQAALPEADWLRKSLEGLPPVQAGRFHLFGQHDRTRRRAGGISLEIGAGTAFGTGHHGTTAGCLLALDHLLKYTRPTRVLDLGCGSGVLAMAAARALHRSVLASDIDPEAVRVAAANAVLNGLKPLLRTLCAAGTHAPVLRAGAPYDLIFANILARPLVHLAPALSRMLARRGHLVLSGITLNQVRQIRAVYRGRGLVVRQQLALEHWATLVLAK